MDALSLIARGGRPVQLDRERIVFYEAEDSFLVVQRFQSLNPAPLNLYVTAPLPDVAEGEEPPARTLADLQLVSMDALLFFLWAGLRADSRMRGEQPPTPEEVHGWIAPRKLPDIFRAVVLAWMNSNDAPAPEGKAEAATARPASAATKRRPARPAPSSPKRSGSPSGNSAGRRNGSGGRRSRN